MFREDFSAIRSSYVCNCIKLSIKAAYSRVDRCHFPAEDLADLQDFWQFLVVFVVVGIFSFLKPQPLDELVATQQKKANQTTGRVVSKGILSRRVAGRGYFHRWNTLVALESPGGAPWCAELLAHEGVVAFKATIPEVGQ